MAPNTVLLNIRNHFEKDFPLSSGGTPLYPGMIAEFTADRKLIPHDTAAGVPAPLLIVVEMPIRSGADINTAFDVTNEAVPVHYALSGDELYVRLEAGANITKGDNLESSGNGNFQAATSGAVVQATEAVNNSAGYDGTFIRVEVL